MRQRLKALACGLMPRVVFEKLATLQLLDVRVPTTDGRELLLVRRTEPDRDLALLLARLQLELPPQPPPRIVTAKAAGNQSMEWRPFPPPVSKTQQNTPACFTHVPSSGSRANHELCSVV